MGQKLINLIGIYFKKLEENKIKNSSNFLFLSQRGKKITRQAFGIESRFMLQSWIGK